MRKLLVILFLLICCDGFIFAQQAISGRVADESNKPLLGATIAEKGTNNFTLTKNNGLFSITIKKGSRLLISAVEMEPVDTIANGSFLNIQLLPRFADLQNVEVVTAQGIRRKPAEIGYATSVVKSDQLMNGRSPTLAQSLSGKVAGLTIYNVNNSVNNDTRIVLRGDRSITGNNEALIVLNDVPVPSTALNFLNPNDIENVTVLKGGQAATLYGSDGVNGVLVITTKKSVKNKIEINYTSSYDIDKVSSLPAFQTEFGSGAQYGLTQQEDYRPYENQSYGDKFDGSIRAVGRVLEDGSVLELPYAPVKDQKKKVWNTGNVVQNDVSLTAGGDKSSFHLSVQNYINNGIVPEDEYKRNNIHFYGNREFGKLKTSFDGIYSTDRTQRTTAYFYIDLLNTPEEIPINELKDWRHDKFANPNGYFNDWASNPWFDLETQRMDRRNNYFYGNLSLSLQATKWFNIKYRFSTTSFASFSKSWVEPFTYTQWAISKAYTLDPKYNDYYGIPRAMGGQPGYVQDDGGVSNIINSDLILTFEHHWKNYSASVIFGNNIQSHWTKDVNVSATSVVIPGVYNVSNRQGILDGNENNTLLHKFGNYMDATVGYKDFAFLETSIRYDGSSVFINPNQPNRNNKYFYYGFSGSFIITKIIPGLVTDFLNYGQIRLSYNKNINANLDPYVLLPTLSNGAGFPFGNTIGITANDLFPNPSIEPERVRSFEVGIETQHLKNRIIFDATFYHQFSEDQILPVSISPSTGYNTTLLNAAKIANWGVEAESKIRVVRDKNFTFYINANYSFNTNEVKGLFLNVNQANVTYNNQLANIIYGDNAFIYAETGKPFPYLKVTGYQRDPASGKIIIDPTDGWPIIDTALHDVGTTIPKSIVGLGIQISYKQFSFSMNGEYRSGCFNYNGLGEDLAFSGEGKQTDIYHRLQFIWPNSVYQDANNKYVANTTIPVSNYIAIMSGWGSAGFSRSLLYSGDMFVTSAAFWKIRDASLTYTFPEKVLNKIKFLRSAAFTIYGRNLLTLLPSSNWYTDPEFANTTGNEIGINNSLNTPPVRSFGAALNVTF